MEMTPAMQEFILHWGDMGSRWGVNRSVAQIHALLHIAPAPLTAEEISETLGLARSNVSVGLKDLLSWKLVKTSRRLGDRRDHFTAIEDLFDLVTAVVESRREREFQPTLTALREVARTADSDGTPKETRKRIAQTLETMEIFDDWYREVASLPRGAQLTLLRMGGKIARLAGKSKKKKAAAGK